MRIGKAEIKACYEISKSVYQARQGKEAGAKELRSKYGMNIGSARDYIRAFACLMDGLLFTRTINAAGAKHYLSKISEDFGDPKLQIAINSLKSHIEYYEPTAKTTCTALRKIVSEFESHMLPLDIEVHHKAFEKAVQKALTDPSSVRKARLKDTPEVPKKITVTSSYFLRSQDVVAEVLLRAAGMCERCKNSAPFMRKSDNTPYLEVHHVVHLAQGGRDTVENAVALCPNCHRRSHFGTVDA